MRRALISVSDKRGVADFAAGLAGLGFEIISTGGTHRLLSEAGIPVVAASDLTGFGEMMDGRVKTLHPAVHAGLLAQRDNPGHMRELSEAGFAPIDLVAVNLYPFEDTVARPDCPADEAIENIDIGGPSMIRSAAKNHQGVIVVVDPDDYAMVLSALEREGDADAAIRLALACKAFGRTAGYDSAIAAYLTGTSRDGGFPTRLSVAFQKNADLRYGENPHQKAAFYADPVRPRPNLVDRNQVSGKELSFNNLGDADAALCTVLEFEGPAAVAVKHANPCGVATGETLARAFAAARAADPVSIYGGIVALNREVDEETAEELAGTFLEVVVAPAFTLDAQAVLARKKNLRLLALEGEWRPGASYLDLRSVRGGLLVQQADSLPSPEDNWTLVAGKAVSEATLHDLRFAWKVARHVKSNAIVLATAGATVGIGGGQTNRIDAARIAFRAGGSKASGAVLASDGFFPFDDVVREAANAGIRAIVQPGGSLHDDLSIAAAGELGLSMYFTGRRHFRH